MKLRALLELCRISNLPTVWSNCFLGFIVAIALDFALVNLRMIYLEEAIALFRTAPWLFIHFACVLVGIGLIYCGGMVLNDYWDREIDTRERPTRPIPSGRIEPRSACILSLVLLLGGYAIASAWIPIGTMLSMQWYVKPIPFLTALSLLLLFVVLYNRTHGAKVSVFLMAACRSLAFLTPAVLYIRPHILFTPWAFFLVGPALIIFFYTVLISIVARHEVEQGSAAKPRRFMFLPASFGGPKTVMNMIAAMPLLDAVWLVVMGLWPASLFCVACAGMTKLAHRRVAGS